MAGAAVTISVLTLAAVHTLGIKVDMPTAFILSILSAVSACGASGVAGGSLLLIPLACSPVSYTHLRAHETKANLVCRLLLEKKKTKTKINNNTTKQQTTNKQVQKTKQTK